MPRGTQAIINLANLKSNYEELKRQSNSKLVLVVKADAYGHGLKQVVSSLGEVDCYAVATLNEAKIIRNTLPEVKILLLEGYLDAEERDWSIDNNIDCVIHHSHQLDLLFGSKSSKKINIWLKMDSGMNRLGFSPDDFEQAIRSLQDHKQSWNELVLMSHFANADDRDDSFNLKQQQAFFEKADKYQFPTCFKNSSAHLNQFDFRNDWTRIGLALYGVSPLPGDLAAHHNLKPVMTVQSSIIALKSIKKGEGVGYGQIYKAPKDMDIAIIGMGYGDGYPWSKSSNSKLSISGHRVPIIGKVSMDMMAVDVSELKKVELGQTVLIWGETETDSNPLETVASEIQTIPYVLSLGLTSRVDFIYKN